MLLLLLLSLSLSLSSDAYQKKLSAKTYPSTAMLAI
jgi:hypothetical protein